MIEKQFEKEDWPVNTPEEIRLELSELLRTHLDEFAYYATLWFDKNYANQTPKHLDGFSERLKWSQSLISGVCDGLEYGAVLTDEFGFFLNVVGEPEFNDFVNALVIQMNLMREIGPLIARVCSSRTAKVREYYSCLNEYLREYVLVKLNDFAVEVSADHFFSRRWDIIVDENLYEKTLDHLSEAHSYDTPSRASSDYESPAAQEKLYEQHANELERLSRRERQVFSMLLEGKSNGEISAKLGVSQNTVKTHVAHVFDKLNVNSRVELLRKMLVA